VSKRLAVRVLHECFIAGAYRKPGQIFLVDESLLDHPEKLPSCLQRVTARRVDEPELVEVP